MNSNWTYGQKRSLCKLSGISDQDLQTILTRRIRCNPQRAAALADASTELGLDIPMEHWMWNQESTHWAFRGDPILDLPGNVELEK